MSSQTLKHRRFRRQGGFTLMELMIATAISAFVVGGVISLQLITARTMRDIYGPMQSRSERLNALNQIRFRLCDAKIGSCVVSDEGRRLRFEDPTVGDGVTSEFYFDQTERILYYEADVSSGNTREVAKGPISITFELGNDSLDPGGTVPFGSDSVVTLRVETADELVYANVDERDGETVVYLRNP
ncbi:type II secretion system protein J [Candidatus Sumerlaeota bacterium]